MAAATATPTLKALTVPATSRHTSTVIFIHGLGDTGNGWKDVADMFSSELPHVKWVLPHAPRQKVTGNMGQVMPAWFDIFSFGFDVAEDETGMLKSVGWINELIDAEVQSGIDPSRIVLGGFSQGGAISLLTGLTTDKKLAGLAVLSCWLPLNETFKKRASSHAASIPVFWGHGEVDPLVRINMAKESVDFLVNQLGFHRCQRGEVNGVSYNTYRGLVHSASMEELSDLLKWLKNIIGS